MVEKETERLIRQWTLANAVEHDGKASVDAVIGKLIAEKPELKSDVKNLKEEIEDTVHQVNEMSQKDQKSEIEKIGSPEREEKEEKGLTDLPDVGKYPEIVTRFAPNPNGPLHVGHARTAVLSHEYARRNDGRFILRFEDTNPIDAKEEFYELIREDLRWLGINWDEEYIQSNRLDRYYGYLEKLLEEEKAYICTCPPKKFKDLRDNQKACPCRELDPQENNERWRKMLEGSYEEGEAVVRIKTDLNDPNPALRDWPALRIVSSSHPRTKDKYRVWPLYNFSVAIDDHEMGVTHVLRGKEHEINEQRQRQLFKHLGWEYPTAIQHGRLSISGTVLSKTKISEGIEKGKYRGYDDVRLGTLAAMRKRGITAEALREIVTDVGTTRADSTLSMETLYTKNRRIIDEEANRYFFTPNPKRLLIHNVPDESEVEIRLHPDDPDRGDRTIPLEMENGSLAVWIAESDLKEMKEGDIIRLKDFLNFKLISSDSLEGEYDSFELKDVPKIQWISKNPVDVKILKPDGSKETGYGEPEVANLSEGDIIQFERYGFVRIETTKPVVKATYAHF